MTEQPTPTAVRTAHDAPPRTVRPDNGHEDAALGEVVEYWNSHLNTTQFLGETVVEEGTPAFFDAIEAGFRRFPYKSRLFDRVAALPGKELLEIGCGLGNDLCELARRGLRVTGIDIAPRAVELAAQHLAIRGLDGTARVANCEQLDFEDDSFDIVYSSGVIQHTPDIDAAVREMFRVLRPGGTMIVILYHRYSWFKLLSMLTRTNVEFDDVDAPIIRTFSRSELRRLFGHASELSIEMEHYRPVPTVRPGVLSALFNRVFIPCYGALPTALIRPLGWHAVVKAQRR